MLGAMFDQIEFKSISNILPFSKEKVLLHVDYKADVNDIYKSALLIGGVSKDTVQAQMLLHYYTQILAVWVVDEDNIYAVDDEGMLITNATHTNQSIEEILAGGNRIDATQGVWRTGRLSDMPLCTIVVDELTKTLAVADGAGELHVWSDTGIFTKSVQSLPLVGWKGFGQAATFSFQNGEVLEVRDKAILPCKVPKSPIESPRYMRAIKRKDGTMLMPSLSGWILACTEGGEWIALDVEPRRYFALCEFGGYLCAACGKDGFFIFSLDDALIIDLVDKQDAGMPVSMHATDTHLWLVPSLKNADLGVLLIEKKTNILKADAKQYKVEILDAE
jgi:hypothetical protein